MPSNEARVGLRVYLDDVASDGFDKLKVSLKDFQEESNRTGGAAVRVAQAIEASNDRISQSASALRSEYNHTANVAVMAFNKIRDAFNPIADDLGAFADYNTEIHNLIRREFAVTAIASNKSLDKLRATFAPVEADYIEMANTVIGASQDMRKEVAITGKAMGTSLGKMAAAFQPVEVEMIDLGTTVTSVAQDMRKELAITGKASQTSLGKLKSALEDIPPPAALAAAAIEDLSERGITGVNRLSKAKKELKDAALDANSGITVLTGGMRSYGHVMDSVNDATEYLENIFTFIGPVMNFFTGTLTKMYTESSTLEEAINKLGKAAGVQANQFSYLREKILEAHTETKLAATEIGDAYTFLVTKGYTLKQILDDGLGVSALRFAKVTNLELVPAAELMTTALQTFGLKASDTSRVSDMLVNSWRNGISDLSSLQGILEDSAGTIDTLGLSMQDFLSILAVMSKNGMPDTTKAAEVLRNMLQSLTMPSNEAAAALADVGLIAVDTTVPGVQSVISKFEELSGTDIELDGTLTDLEKLYTNALEIDALNTDKSFLAWAESVGALNNKLYDAQGNLLPIPKLIAEVSKAFDGIGNNKEKIQQLADALQIDPQQLAKLATLSPQITSQTANTSSAIGTPGSTTKELENGAKGSTDALKGLTNAWNTLIGVLGTPFNNTLQPLMLSVTELLDTVRSANPDMITFIGTFLSVISIVTPILLVVGIFVGLGIILQSLLVPVLAIVAGLLAFSVVVGVLTAYWNNLQPILAQVFSILATTVGVVTVLSMVFAGMVAIGLASFALEAAITFGSMLVVLIAMLPVLIANAVAWVLMNLPLIGTIVAIGLLVGLVAMMIVGFSVLMNHLGGWSAWMKVFNVIWTTLQGIWSSFVASVMPAFQQAWANLKPAIDQLMMSFQQAYPIFLALGAVLGFFVAVAIGQLIGLLQGLALGLAGLLGGLAIAVAGIIQIFAGVMTFVMGFWTFIVGIFTLNGDMVLQGLWSMGEGVKNIFLGLWNTVVGLVSGLWGAVAGFLSGFVSGFIGFFYNLWDVLVGHSIVPDMVIAIVAWITGMPGKILGSIGRFVLDMIGKFVEMATGGRVKSQDLVNNITSVISNLGPLLFAAGGNAMHMFADGIGNATNWVIGAISGVAQRVKDFLGFHSPTEDGPLSDSDTYFPNMMRMYAQGISQNKGLLLDAANGVAASLNAAFTTPSMARLQYQQAFSSSYSGGNAVINVHIDGERVERVVADRFTGALKMQGMNRAWR